MFYALMAFHAVIGCDDNIAKHDWETASQTLDTLLALATPKDTTEQPSACLDLTRFATEQVRIVLCTNESS